MALPLFLWGSVPVNVLALAKQQGNAPKTCQSYYGEYNAAHNCRLSAEDPTYHIEIEYTYTTPVQCADNNENKCYSV